MENSVDVYTGGHDQACAALGAGATNADTGLYSIGTTEAVAVTLDQFQPELCANNISPYPHVYPGKFVALMGSQSGGRLLQWFKELRGLATTEALFEGLPDLPSRTTVVPHFSGSGSVLSDENARAIISDLTFETTPQEVTHAILEGITMEQALALKRACDLGVAPRTLRIVGGGSQSPEWMQIKADILDLPIDSVDNRDTACAGAAILAGLGSSVFSSIDDAVTRFVHLGNRYKPRAAFSEIYRAKLGLYFEIYKGQVTQQALQGQISDQIELLKSKMGNLS